MDERPIDHLAKLAATGFRCDDLRAGRAGLVTTMFTNAPEARPKCQSGGSPCGV